MSCTKEHAPRSRRLRASMSVSLCRLPSPPEGCATATATRRARGPYTVGRGRSAARNSSGRVPPSIRVPSRIEEGTRIEGTRIEEGIAADASLLLFANRRREEGTRIEGTRIEEGKKGRVPPSPLLAQPIPDPHSRSLARCLPVPCI